MYQATGEKVMNLHAPDAMRVEGSGRGFDSRRLSADAPLRLPLRLTGVHENSIGPAGLHTARDITVEAPARGAAKDGYDQHDASRRPEERGI